MAHPPPPRKDWPVRLWRQTGDVSTYDLHSSSWGGICHYARDSFIIFWYTNDTNIIQEIDYIKYGTTSAQNTSDTSFDKFLRKWVAPQGRQVATGEETGDSCWQISYLPSFPPQNIQKPLQPLLAVIISDTRLSVDGACLSLASFIVPTPVKTILELFRPAFGVLPKTGDAEPIDRGKPGWE